ncbi:MAG: hypothetical protein Q8J97_10830, partial [Flavobacteriaceae bacterium]|nr:hypothetical protein [Flavobacteriaceae bacterium]
MLVGRGTRAVAQMVLLRNREAGASWCEGAAQHHSSHAFEAAPRLGFDLSPSIVGSEFCVVKLSG